MATRKAAEANAAAAAAVKLQQAQASSAQSDELSGAAAQKAELDAKRAAQAAKLAALEKEEQDLQRAAEAEKQREAEHALKLAEAKAAAEANKAAAEAEKERRRQATEEAARIEAERRLKDAAAAAVRKEEQEVKQARSDDDLTEWHGKANIATLSPAERLRQIEDAEREAILEVDSGSANNNDDAILQAMRRTNPDAYEEAVRGRDEVAAKLPLIEAKQEVRGQLGIPASRGATLARKQADAKVALADADYLLSMIQSGVDEDSEVIDSVNGARYHVNSSGEKVYRLGDLPSDTLDGYLSVDDTMDSPTPMGTAEWSTTTLQRRTKNLSDVERRREEAERRKKEAWARSLERSSSKAAKAKKGKSASRKGKTSETNF